MTGLVHGNLSGQDLSKLTGLSVLRFVPGDALVISWSLSTGGRQIAWQPRRLHMVRHNKPGAFEYLGEYADDTRTVILAPEGGWKSNPVPGRVDSVVWSDGELRLVRAGVDSTTDWPMVASVRLIEDAKPSDYEECAADQGVAETEDLVARLRGEPGDCAFCGRDPYHYVDNGVGMERVAVTCCDEGIALYQHGDEVLSRQVQLRYEAADEIERLRGLPAKPEGEGAPVEGRGKTRGQIAYEGWSQGLPGCEWANQTPTQKRAWEAAASAVLRASPSGLAGEPVAWRYRWKGNFAERPWRWAFTRKEAVDAEMRGYEVRAVYEGSTPSADQSGVIGALVLALEKVRDADPHHVSRPIAEDALAAHAASIGGKS